MPVQFDLSVRSITIFFTHMISDPIILMTLRRSTSTIGTDLLPRLIINVSIPDFWSNQIVSERFLIWALDTLVLFFLVDIFLVLL